jgi:hypothetical protein
MLLLIIHFARIPICRNNTEALTPSIVLWLKKKGKGKNGDLKNGKIGSDVVPRERTILLYLVIWDGLARLFCSLIIHSGSQQVNRNIVAGRKGEGLTAV